MKNITFIFLAIFFLIFNSTYSQDKYFTKKGHIWFFSHTAMEDIEAHNNEAAVVFDIKTGDISSQLLMKSFKFQKALMEEHFNENYIESAKFPKGEFKGKITNLKEIDFSKNGTYKATAEGTITVHGISKSYSITGNIEVNNGKIAIKAKFTIAPQDFSIAIPDLVKNNIAKTIEIYIDVTLEIYKK